MSLPPDMVSAFQLLASNQLDTLCLALGLPCKSPSTTSTKQSVRIVSCDLELYYYAQQDVTAIGLAVLHTDDIELGKPGKNGVEWIPNTECFNIRPRETGHQRNDNKHLRTNRRISSSDAMSGF